MKVLIAMDSFKGAFSSLRVADIVEKGIRRVYESAVVDKVAIADGGEGTVEAIIDSLKGEYKYVSVSDPSGKVIKSKYGIVNGDTAVLEMAEDAGLYLIPENERIPLITSTYGIGEMIIDALNHGCKKIRSHRYVKN